MTREFSPFIEIGYIARAHGIQGEVRVVTHDPMSTTLHEIESIRIGDCPYRVAQARSVQGAILLRLTDVTSREQAQALRGKTVLVDRAHVDVDPDQVLLADLVGCDVALADGTPYGTIAAVETGPQDRLVIHDGNIERLLPLVPVFVTAIDLQAGLVVVAPPQDLPETRRR